MPIGEVKARIMTGIIGQVITLIVYLLPKEDIQYL